MSITKAGTAQGRKFRLVTLNTWKSSGDYPLRMRAMENGFKELEPTVICLQESFLSTDNLWNTAEILARALDMEMHLISYRRKQRPVNEQSMDSFSGLAVLSSCPIQHTAELQLETTDSDGDRSAQITTISLAGCALTVINLHLTHLPDFDSLRVRQLDNVLSLCRRENFENTLICGDFNSPLSLFDEAGQLAPRGELQDTWMAIHGDLPHQPTIHARYRDPAVEAETGSIDHVLYLPGSGPELRCLASKIVFHEPDRSVGLHPSDHCGVCLDFAMPQ